MRSTRIAVTAALILGLSAIAAPAQVDVAPGVARISLIHGDVSTQRGDSGDWSVAALNAPIVSGDKISTGVRSRAEVQLDHANILRLDGDSQAGLAALSRTHIQVQISRGLADYTVFKGTEADVEINTPNVAVRPILNEGVYRIEVNSEGETRVIVRKGEAEISTPQGSTRVRKGELATVRGNDSEAVYRIADAPGKDAWDSWNSDRDHLIQDARGWRYTNRYYVGSEDLDAYGRWVTVPDYGPVWAPAVGPGWAPYRLGRWVWEPYWGWTWISYEPWGWAPYHYGRWFVWAGSWVWWPGPVFPRYRPIWAPAYVSFFGFGGRGFGVSIGFGSVGWLPIGPCDRFFPWYGSYRSHFNVVNITNITRINVIRDGHGFDGYAPLRHGDRHSNLRLAMRDEHMRGAISMVPGEHFGTGTVAARAVDRAAFRDAHMMTGNLPIVPTRATLSPTNRPGQGHTGADRERFFTRSPSGPRPESFDRQAAQVQENIRRSGRFTPIRAEGRQEPVDRMRPQNQPNRAADGQRGEERTARPSPENRAERNQPGRRENADARPSPDVRANRPGDIPRGREDKADGRPSAESRTDRADAPTSPRGGNEERGDRQWQRFGGPDMAQNQPAQNQQTQNRGRQNPPPSAEKRNAQPQRPERPANDGWRRFSRSDDARNRPAREDRPAATPGREARPADVPERGREVRPAPAETPNRGSDWRRFPAEDRSGSREARPAAGDRPSENRPAAAETPNRGSEWRRFPAEDRSSNARENRAPAQRESPRANRPPLDLRQPVVTPRAPRQETPRNSGARPSGGNRSAPRGDRGGKGGDGGRGQRSSERH